MNEYRIPVYNDSGDIVGTVRYNANLDYWDGHTWSNGGICNHKGISRLKNGEYVIITGSDFEGERDKAKVTTPENALQEILKSGNGDLLKTKKFKDLGKIYEAMNNELVDE
jgi:hypothetical protein